MARINRPATMINAYGTYLIDPSTYHIEEFATWTSDSGRDAFNKMQGEIMVDKHSFECTWAGITPDEAKTIMRLLRKRVGNKDTSFITITVDDILGDNPASSTETTKTYEVYVGDREVTVGWYANGQRYVDLTLSMIER